MVSWGKCSRVAKLWAVILPVEGGRFGGFDRNSFCPISLSPTLAPDTGSTWISANGSTISLGSKCSGNQIRSFNCWISRGTECSFCPRSFCSRILRSSRSDRRNPSSSAQASITRFRSCLFSPSVRPCGVCPALSSSNSDLVRSNDRSFESNSSRMAASRRAAQSWHSISPGENSECGRAFEHSAQNIRFVPGIRRSAGLTAGKCRLISFIGGPSSMNGRVFDRIVQNRSVLYGMSQLTHNVLLISCVCQLTHFAERLK